jgi:UDP-3-O-[3-hydroxymyristoyl] glucosamine N-acyltransferase
MYQIKKGRIYASEIAGFLNKPLIGTDFVVDYPASSKAPVDGSFIFLDKEVEPTLKDLGESRVLVLAGEGSRGSEARGSWILTENPKLDFIKALKEFFLVETRSQLAQSAKIHPEAQIGRGVFVGENAVIGPNVKIGDGTKVSHNVVIAGDVEIGPDCFLKDNCSVGSENYNFVLDERGVPIHYPNIGKIRIGRNVWIGANSSIEGATFDETAIEDYVKIDDLVQIGDGAVIERKCLITAGVIISRGVRIGTESLIAPNATVRENIRIGQRVVVGTGAVVVKDLESDGVYVGNPARFLKRNG